MSIGITLRLYNAAGTALTSQSGITALWWDKEVPENFNNPVGKTTIATTDSNGDLILDLSACSTLSTGEYGFLLLYKLDGTDHKDSPTFSGRVQTSTVSGGTALIYDYVWDRNPLWPALSDTSSNNTFSGLFAVFPTDTNGCAFVFDTSLGTYSVDWGDGSSVATVTSGVTAEHIYDYDDCPDNDVGQVNARACTFTDTGDTVDLTSHGFANGDFVVFAEVTTTTGISVGTRYYVVNAAADTFKVSDTLGGTAKALTTNGTGSVYAPIYRTVVVDAYPTTPPANIIYVNLARMPASLAPCYSPTKWLDIGLNAQNATQVYLNYTYQFPSLLEHFSGDVRSITNGYALFAGCRSLIKISSLNVSSCTSFGYMFSETYLLKYIPNIDTSNGTNFAYMFSASGLEILPPIDVSSGTNFAYMFNSSRLKRLPDLDTSAGTNFIGMFYQCKYLEHAPKLDTSLGTVFEVMFFGCNSLVYIPGFDTSSGNTTFYGMFAGCINLRTVPALDLTASPNLSDIFSGCYSLGRSRVLNTKLTINYTNCQLSADALNEIYTNLPTVTGKTITVTNNPGVSADDPTIATAKGWTVVS